MSKAVFYCSCKLANGASIPDFLLAAENLNNEFISKQKGYISWKQLHDGDTWADYITFESLDDAIAFEENSVNAGEVANVFYSFIDLNSCVVNRFTIERDYK